MDECYLGSHACDQHCVNAPGSYECQCERGYNLARDGYTCLGNHKANTDLLVFTVR